MPVDVFGEWCYTRGMEKEVHLKLTVRLYTDDNERCFGPGIATLLHRVQEHHSLRAAAGSMLASIILPMIALIVVGVFGMAVASFVVAKLLKMSFPMAFANGLTALYGFPCDWIITESTCNALAGNPEERDYLMSQMIPSMIVGGFTTVTITSVFIAGWFATLL